MPQPRKPDRKKPPRVQLRREVATIAEAYAVEQSKDLAAVVNDALRYFFAEAFQPPRWPPRRNQDDTGG